MTAPDSRVPRSAWEAAGRGVAASLDGAAAVVVVGEDPVAAALVALGIGAVQSGRRRVAIGDLVGEVAPLQALVTGDDPHGLVDSFLYGVSLNRIARPVDQSGNLFVLPSGTEPVIAEEIFRNARWGRLATGFRDVGALLLLVAPADAAGVDALARQLDGVVLADAATQPPAGATVLAVAERPAPAALPELSAAAEEAVAAGEGTTATAERAARWLRRIAEAPPTQAKLATVPAPGAGDGAPRLIVPHPAAPAAAAEEPAGAPPRRRARWAYPLAAAIVVGVVGAALLSRGGGTRSEAGRRAAPSRAAAGAATGVATGAPDDATAPAGAPSGAAAAAPLAVSNPTDSALAASYSVQIIAANTIDGARLKKRDVAWGMPAAVISPMSLGADSTHWYRLTVGAFSDRADAVSFLTKVAARRKLDLDAENVVRLPFALLLERGVPRRLARVRTAAFARRGLPAYWLLQPDGTMNVYAGAFESPAQAALLAAKLRDVGVQPVVAYRTGRGF